MFGKNLSRISILARETWIVKTLCDVTTSYYRGKGRGAMFYWTELGVNINYIFGQSRFSLLNFWGILVFGLDSLFNGISTFVSYLMPKPSLLCPSRLGLQNTPTVSLKRCKTSPTSVRDMTLKIWWWGSSNAGALWNAEYPFIAIAPRSTLARSDSTW